MDFWTRLQAAREGCNVLEHPFYERWSRGELERAELATYAGEYRHVVVALAEASRRAAVLAEPVLRPGLDEHADEEAAHVALWDDFAAALDGSLARAPRPETVACARTWAGAERDLLHTLVALYAIESGQPAIAQTKQEGLRAFYGVTDGPAAAYFALHSELDHEHAAAERALIEPLLENADHDALLTTAQDVLRANWTLLDGVERLNGKA